MAKKRVGRPSKLTKTVKDRIIEGVELGMPLERAANMAGVSGRTLANWRERGEKVAKTIEEAGPEGVEVDPEDYKYFQFFLAYEKANAEAMAGHLINLENHARTDPKISMWILERRFSADFRPPAERKELTGADGKDVGLSVGVWRDLTAERREKAAGIYEDFDDVETED